MRVPFVVAIIALTGSCGYAGGVSLLDAPASTLDTALAPRDPAEESTSLLPPATLLLDMAPIVALPEAPTSTAPVIEASRVLSYEPERLDRLPTLMLLPDGALVARAETVDDTPLARGVVLRDARMALAPEARPLERMPAAPLARIDDPGPTVFFAGTRTSAPDPAPLPAGTVFTPQAGSSSDTTSVFWAGGLAAAGAAALLGIALYHRIRPNAALENETRKTIFEAVCATPGLGVHEVSHIAGVSYSTATYHLERLVGAGMIVMTPDGNKLCYYKNGGAFTESERRILPLIKNEEAAKLFEAILTRPGTYRAALAEQLGVTATTINWHLRRLREAGLVDETRAGRSAHLYAKMDALRPVFLQLATKVETTEPTIAGKLRTYAGPAGTDATGASA